MSVYGSFLEEEVVDEVSYFYYYYFVGAMGNVHINAPSLLYYFQALPPLPFYPENESRFEREEGKDTTRNMRMTNSPTQQSTSPRVSAPPSPQTSRASRTCSSHRPSPPSSQKQNRTRPRSNHSTRSAAAWTTSSPPTAGRRCKVLGSKKASWRSRTSGRTASSRACTSSSSTTCGAG